MSGIKRSSDNIMENTALCSKTEMLDYSRTMSDKLNSYSPESSKINCLQTMEARTPTCRHSVSGHLYEISHKCRRLICRTLNTTVRACLVGIILISIFSQASGKTRTEKTPLIFTDGPDGVGFRHFMRRPGALTSGRGLAGRLEENEDLSFQTVKFIKRWGNDTDLLLVGGKDHVYMLDGKFADGNANAMISYRERLTWRTPTRSRNVCVMIPSQPVELCENFIRFIELLDNGELMVCGTNAYSPACRYYKREQFNEVNYGKDSHYQLEEKCREQCVVPYNPTTASVSLYTNTDNGYQIFAAVINDFMSNDPIIMRKDKPTLLSNSLWLNEPTFLKLMEYHDKVYIFFRETAKESESESAEKVIYARVAQVCKNDPGGMNVLAQQWTTFLKARLRCGYTERQHLQFDNLTSVSDVVTISDARGDEMDVFFATFTTPWEWADSSISAVCAYSMREIAKLFDGGKFFGEYEVELRPVSESDMHSMPQPSSRDEGMFPKLTKSYAIRAEDVPNPRPGSCGLAYSPNALYFAKEHPLMYDDAMPLSLAPVHVFHNSRATQITVDNNAGSSGYLILYVGTENGKVLRLRTSSCQNKLETVLIETISVEDDETCEVESCSIRSLHVSRPVENGVEMTPSVFVAFTDYMVQFTVARCSAYKSEECCSVDPDCGWDSAFCVLRTSRNRRTLSSVSQNGDPLPEACGLAQGSTTKCDCNEKNDDECEDEKEITPQDDPLAIDPSILEIVNRDADLSTILREAVSVTMRRQFEETMHTLRGSEQRVALKKQLKEAVASTVGLVLRNHQQEYCLPSPAVNHLTHVYPLILREIELWHETALKKMNKSDFDQKCWSTQKKCPLRISFSLPLLPTLWEPLRKLIQNFSGQCNEIPNSVKHAAAFRMKPRTQCAPLPGLEPCKDVLQPHCRPMRCQFSEYAVDAKAFFRHANDSRQFLGRGAEPLWKPVNFSIPRGESIRGHMELVVADGMPFMIDYSPIAEKVKVMFYYKPVRDCALTDPRCVERAIGCDPDVESIIDDWFKWALSKMSHKMRKCQKEIKKSKKKGSRRRSGRQHVFSRHFDGLNSRSMELDDRTSLFNEIPNIPERCRRVVGKVSPAQSISKNMWSLIASRCQKAGGIYSAFQQKIEFYHLRDVKRFFKNECTFEEPTHERSTFKKSTSRKKLPVIVQPMVTPTTPFVIERIDGKITMKYFVMETPSDE